MSLELKIKALTLGYEAKQIRRFEQRLKRMRHWQMNIRNPDNPKHTDVREIAGTNPEGYEKWGRAKMLSLKHHRTGIVRWTARSTHLARMFLKGTAYKRAEQKAEREPDWDDILRMIERYSEDHHRIGANVPIADQFEEWKKA